MRGLESKETILKRPEVRAPFIVELLNDHIDGLNKGGRQDISEETLSLPPEDRAELDSLLSIDRLLRMVADADKMDESIFRLDSNAR